MSNKKTGPIPCRTAITETLVEEGRRNPDLFVVTSDARGSVTLGKFALKKGTNQLKVKVVAKNTKSPGYFFGLDGIVLKP